MSTTARKIILVVEEEAHPSVPIEEALKSLGYKVVNAYAGDDAGRMLDCLDTGDGSVEQNQLKKNDELFRHISDLTTDYTFRSKISESGRTELEMVNGAFKELTGYSLEEFKAPGHWRSTVHPDDREKDDRAFEKLCRNENAIHDLRTIHKNGTISWMRVYAHPIWDGKANRLAGISGAVRDITERKIVEQELQKSELKYRELFSLLRLMSDTMPDMMWAKDLDNNYIFANRAYCEKFLSASSTSEPIGRNDLFFANRERQAHADDPLWHTFGELCMDTDAITLEAMKEMQFDEYGNIKGKFLFLDVHKAPLINDEGELIGVVGSGRDITERRLADEKLRESELTYRGILNSINEVVYVQGEDGRFLDVNMGGEKLFGYEREDFIGQTVDFLSAPGMNDLAKVRECFARALAGDAQSFEFWGRTRNGRVFEKEVHLYPGVYFGKKCIITIAQDITERKATEQLLRDMQRRESIGIMSGGIAHDFNNLLGSMMGNISLAQTRIPADHQAAPNIDKALVAMERAARLTQQLLAYSGKGKFQISTIDLVKVVKDHVSLFGVSLPKKVRLELHLPPAPVYVNGDPGQFEQIIMNLIINGGEAIEGRSGVVSVTLTQAFMSAADLERYNTITRTSLPEGSYARFEVADNGSGMNAETLAKIFDPFFTTKFTGRGLGLSAVLGIIQGHKGGICVESRIGAGTTFCVILPTHEAPASRVEPATHEERGTSAANGAILIIDDENDVAVMAREMLEAGAYTALVELNPKDAVELFRQRSCDIDLVLLDLTMPEMSGEEVVDALHAIDPGVKIIITSGYSEEEVAKKIGSSTVSAFIQKPYRMRSLLSIVENVMLGTPPDPNA